MGGFGWSIGGGGYLSKLGGGKAAALACEQRHFDGEVMGMAITTYGVRWNGFDHRLLGCQR